MPRQPKDDGKHILVKLPAELHARLKYYMSKRRLTVAEAVIKILESRLHGGGNAKR